MGKLKTAEELFKGRHLDRGIVILCVRWYLRFKLSLRDLVEMMAERGLSMAHTTIMRWVQRYAPEFEKRWPGRSAGHGGSTRHTSRSEASGATCIVPLIGQVGRSISG
jgi:transposase-like protein